MIRAEKEGAVGVGTKRLNRSNKNQTVILVRLEEDPAYREAVRTDRVANNWLTVAPNASRLTSGSVDEDRLWQRIISIVTDVFSDLEQMDRSSFYLRSAWRVRKYDYSEWRSRLVIKRGVGTAGDPTIRVRLENQRKITLGDVSHRMRDVEGTEWTDENEWIFLTDKEVIDHLQDQL